MSSKATTAAEITGAREEAMMAAERHRELNRLRFERLATEGRCRGCSGPLGDEHRGVHCARCADRGAARMRELQQRRIEEGLCRDCGEPRGEDGRRTRCRSCAKRRAARRHEKLLHLAAEGLCCKCREPLGEGGTETMCSGCAAAAKVSARELCQRRIEEGLCRDCGEPLGEGGTPTRCRRCLDKRSANALTRRQRLVSEGLCCKCRGPLGEGGTETMCARCADRYATRSAEARRSRIENSVCPQHGAAMPMLDLCPACLYEQPGGRIDDLTFEQLLPPPSSGDRLESCIGCKRCGRTYHEGGTDYRVPALPRDLKLRDEHVGEEGAGMWLLFTQGNEKDTPVKYERCSTPDKECAGEVSRSVARDYLAMHRRGKELLGVCRRHALNPWLLFGSVEGRLRHQLDATEQPQNGSRQESASAEKRRHKPHAKETSKPPMVLGKTIDDLNAAILKLYDALLVNSEVTATKVASELGLGRIGFGDEGHENIRRLLRRNNVKDSFPHYRDKLIAAHRSGTPYATRAHTAPQINGGA